MNREETLKVFSVLKANYNNFFKTLSRTDAEAMVNLWNEMFFDSEYRLVGAAVKAYIASDTTGYPPNVGQINEQIRKLTASEEMTEQEAVGMIMKALSNGIYGAREEFDKLPPILQKLVGSPQQLRDWATMDIEEINTVISSNLMRSYRTLAKRETERQALPSNLVQMIEAASEQLRLESKERGI